jgi:4'-phosphopantetheinyl transferase
LTATLHFTPWPPSSGAPPLGPGDLHLWRIQTGDPGISPSDLAPLLDAGEQVRAQRLATPTLRARYVRAHGGLRRILALYLGQAPGDIAFTQGLQGKPALAAPPYPAQLEFNLTGSGDLTLVAISLDLPVGVDCERVRPCNELLGVARRMFSPEIAEALAETPEPNRLAAFYTAWTALEAEVKADGRGLFQPRVPGDLAADQMLAVAHCLPLPDYVAAVARTDLPLVEQWGTFDLVD